MPDLDNQTPLPAHCAVLADPDGIDVLVTAVKASFDLQSGQPRLREPQMPLTLTDEYGDQDSPGSLRRAADISLPKEGTDVLLTGRAWAPAGRARRRVDVSLKVGPVAKTVRVFGVRKWGPRLLGWRISEPLPFHEIPLEWERAFGGSARVGGKETIETELRNPTGLGYAATRAGRRRDGLPLPQLEDPRALIVRPGDSPRPSCFAPVAPGWEPRRSRAGNYDDTWQRERAPYLPEDFDQRFLQIAPLDQVCHPPLEGGEEVEVRNATPSGELRFALPRDCVSVHHHGKRSRTTRRAVLDTVWIDTDENRLEMVWRSALRLDQQAPWLRQVEIEWRGDPACGPAPVPS